MSVTQLVDFNGRGEVVFHGGDVGREGVTMLFYERAGRESAIIFEGLRFTQKQNFNEQRKQRRRILKIVAKSDNIYGK